MQIGDWKTAASYLFGIVALGCLAAGIVSEVLDKDLGFYGVEGANIEYWFYIAIAVFVGAAWLAILRLRSQRKVKTIPPESEESE